MTIETPEQQLNRKVEEMKAGYPPRLASSPVRDVRPGQSPFDALVSRNNLLGEPDVEHKVLEAVETFRRYCRQIPHGNFTVFVDSHAIKERVLAQLVEAEKKPWRTIAIR